MSALDDVLDALEAEAGGTVKPCPVAALLATLQPDTAERLVRVLNGKQSTRKIHGELTAVGISLGRDSLGAHRNGWCRCKAATT